MPSKATPHSVFRLPAKAKSQLEALAQRKGVTQTAVLIQLIGEAADGHDAYYLRTACINSFASAAMLQSLVAREFKGETPAVLGKLASDLAGFFGESPEPPEEFQKRRGRDPRLVALFEAYGFVPEG